MITDVDVLVVGAGPAGTTCAYILHKQKNSCLLVDCAVFPRDKVCGGGLTPRSWRLLDELYPSLQYDYLPVSRIWLYMKGKCRGVYSLDREVRVVKRKDFDNRLLNEYLDSGGAFLSDRLTSLAETEDGFIEVTMKSGRKIRCRYLVGADGANSRVRRYLNPESKADFFIVEQYRKKSGEDEITIELSVNYKYGYYYVFPNTEFDVAGFGYKGLLKNKEKMSSLLQHYGMEREKLLGAYITPVIDYPQHSRIFLVGDAGCWCDRLTYEGIYYALATGRNAANAIISGKPFCQENKKIASSKRHRNFAAFLLYNRFGLWVVKLISQNRRLTEKILNGYMR